MSDFGRACHQLALEIVAGVAIGFLLFCWSEAFAQVRYSDYAMLGERHAALLADSNGTFAAEMIVQPIDGRSRVYWRPPGGPSDYYEVFELKDNPATSTRWWFLTHFCRTAGCDPITTQRATLEIGGQVFEISRPEIPGHPYAPETFTAPYVIRIWGRSGPTPFHWRASMSMPAEITSPQWRTDGNRTRMAIRQDEEWTDSSGSSTRFNYLGRGAGIGFAGENDGWRYGIAWAWRY